MPNRKNSGMMNINYDPAIDAYIDKAEDFAKPILEYCAGLSMKIAAGLRFYDSGKM